MNSNSNNLYDKETITLNEPSIQNIQSVDKFDNFHEFQDYNNLEFFINTKDYSWIDVTSESEKNTDMKYNLNNTNTKLNKNKKCGERVKGTVKWFNNKLGYGFISHKNKNGEEQDIFVHWSNLLIPEHDFRTLYKDEIVEFEINKCTQSQFAKSNSQSIQACKVSGPNFSKLLSAKNSCNSFTTNYYTSSKYSNVFNVKQLSLDELVNMEKNSNKMLNIYKKSIPETMYGNINFTQSSN